MTKYIRTSGGEVIFQDRIAWPRQELATGQIVERVEAFAEFRSLAALQDYARTLRQSGDSALRPVG